MNASQIKEKYKEYILTNGAQPVSVFAFCKKLKISESEFFDEFGSFNTLENEIWVDFFEQTRTQVEQDELFANYSVREKVLSFFFTLIEILKQQRSYVLYQLEKEKIRDLRKNKSLSLFREQFLRWATRFLLEGIESREVESRILLDQQYARLLWWQLLFVLYFWVHDRSKGFEKTDTAIEKSVNTAFDLLAKSPLESVFDLSKFIFQNR